MVVRDRRRIDPETGELRTSQPAEEFVVNEAAPTAAAGSADPATAGAADAAQQELQTQLEERTADLQRVSAEYANYRKRVDRDREAVITSAKAGLVTDLLPLLDDLERAEAHGDLTGAFKSVADKLVASLEKAGLTPFATEGDSFDPSVHEAVQHNTSSDVDGPTVTAVLRRGYRFGDRVVRAALVAVTDYEGPVEPADPIEVGFTEEPGSTEES